MEEYECFAVRKRSRQAAHNETVTKDVKKDVKSTHTHALNTKQRDNTTTDRAVHNRTDGTRDKQKVRARV